jgi:ubiquinone/menaquinone biosynthesis C-methylase UbiE
MPHRHTHASPDDAGAFHHPERYDRLARRWLRRLYARVASDVAAAGLPEGSRVLDVGTGPGRVPLAIATTSPGLVIDGVDLAEEMIDHARRLTAHLGDRVSFTAADVAKLPYPDATFDLIVSTLSQHHWRDVDGGLGELLRVLRPGGQIWIYDLRFALRRVRAAARRQCPAGDVSRHTVRTGPLSLGLLARLTVRPHEPGSAQLPG